MISSPKEQACHFVILLDSHWHKECPHALRSPWETQISSQAVWMHDQGVILIEQPLPVDMDKDMPWLKERSPLPLFADESARRLRDLDGLTNAFSGINIKLMKSTGIREAIQMREFAKKNDLQIM